MSIPAAVKQITICVGTVHGGALKTAQLLQSALAEIPVKATLYDHPRLEHITANEHPVLICTSTTGAGDLPANIAPLYTQLTSEFPNIVSRPFGVICLGDSSYGETFGGAGRLMTEAFTELAAQQIAETLTIDAQESTAPAELALPWTFTWLKKLSAM